MPENCSLSELEKLRPVIATPDLPELGPGPRASVLPLATLNQKLDGFLSHAPLASAAHEAIRAAVLLWHDHLEAAHQIAQDLPGPDGSFLHGIIHRREPDYGNAKYWFQRVGRHACFERLASQAADLLQSQNAKALRGDLIPRGQWDPFAFVDACEKAAGQPGAAPETQLLRAIQGMEFELLLERFCQFKAR